MWRTGPVTLATAGTTAQGLRARSWGRVPRRRPTDRYVRWGSRRRACVGLWANRECVSRPRNGFVSPAMCTSGDPICRAPDDDRQHALSQPRARARAHAATAARSGRRGPDHAAALPAAATAAAAVAAAVSGRLRRGTVGGRRHGAVHDRRQKPRQKSRRPRWSITGSRRRFSGRRMVGRVPAVGIRAAARGGRSDGAGLLRHSVARTRAIDRGLRRHTERPSG